MDKWILAVGYDRPHFEAARKDWADYNVHLDSADTIAEAVKKLYSRQYLAVIAAFDSPDLLPLIDLMNAIKQVPLVILSQDDSGTKLSEAITRGADTFIIDPDDLAGFMTDNQEIIDRLAKIPTHERRAKGILIHRDIFMIANRRQVFVHGEEIHLTKNDFDILQMLLSEAGRVFTYEQIYLCAYSEETPAESIVNAVRCQIGRIRHKLDVGPEPVKYIDTVRGIGYRMAVA